MDIKFGRLESAFDERDYDLNEFVPKFRLSPITEKTWNFNSEALNQGDTNHCVGFSMAAFGISDPIFSNFTNEDAHSFYYKCKELEGRPKNEEGSNLRSAAKILKQAGKIDGYAFARSIDTIKWWILNRGPVIVGTLWMEGMMRPNIDNKLNISGNSLGGHAYMLNEWRNDGYFGIQNSWGNGWGKNGKAYIASTDFSKIFARGGEAITAVEVEKQSFFSRFF